jgi:CRISPR/Cas system CSM-associated protein Csm2 small subunit
MASTPRANVSSSNNERFTITAGEYSFPPPLPPPTPNANKFSQSTNSSVAGVIITPPSTATTTVNYNAPATTTTVSRFATVSDFHELIAQEVYVDFVRLRFLAFHGIPSSTSSGGGGADETSSSSSSLRGTVWKLLIPKMLQEFEFHHSSLEENPVSIPNPQISSLSTGSSSSTSTSSSSFTEIAKSIRETLDVYQQEESFFRRLSIRNKMEKSCLQYISNRANHSASFVLRDPKILVYLYGPFLYVTKGRTESAELMFGMFMEMLEEHNKPKFVELNFKKFMTLFRSQFPKLCAHFEDEELDARKWVSFPRLCLVSYWS